jgi:hypothetical protein
MLLLFLLFLLQDMLAAGIFRELLMTFPSTLPARVNFIKAASLIREGFVCQRNALVVLMFYNFVTMQLR